MTFRSPALRTLAALFALSAMAPAQASGDIHPRIIGGDDASAGEYPFMAALVYSAQPNDFQAQFCGGTVIAPRWVLTAAHCMPGLQPADLQVIAGETKLENASDTGLRTAVAAILVHPGYNDNSLLNDIALLYLAAPVATSATFAIDSTSLLLGLTEGDDLTAIGWGVVEETPDGDVFTQILQEVQLDYVPQSVCNSTYYPGDIATTAFCAYYQDNTALPRDTCRGDSGGPLMRATVDGWRQVGITSFGFSDLCATPDYPGVYTRVSAYSGWVLGAQDSPDLKVTATTLSSSSKAATVRFQVSNLSPANAAPATQLSITFEGDVSVTNLAALAGCSATVGGSLLCDLGTLAATKSSGNFDVALQFSGTGTFRVTGTATSTGGDYYVINNSAVKTFKVGSSGGGGGGALPALSLLTLGLCLLRRRPHAPHRPLRLR